MTSISSMPYAVRKNDSNWIKDTAEDIKKLRLKHGDTHPYYELIKDSFYCYGCYKKWIKENHTEPFDYALPKLTHYIYENGNKTHFKLRRKSQEKIMIISKVAILMIHQIITKNYLILSTISKLLKNKLPASSY